MTAAFAVALAVAVIALLLLAAATRRAAGAARREQQMAAGHAEQLDQARREADQARADADAARADAEAAGAEAAVARAGAEEADKRAAEAERRAESFQAEILRAETLAAERRVELSSSPSAGAVLWQLERLRCEREWSEVVGPGVPLPVEWDETLGAVLATEMAIIREVIGTPGEVQVEEAVPLSEVPQAVTSVRLGVELTRAMARSGEEMVVAVSADSVVVDQRVIGPVAVAGLDRLQAAASAVGAEITVDEADERMVARLKLPPASRP